MADVATAAPGVAIVIVVTLLLVLAARRVPWALPALVIVTAADLGYYGIRFVYQEPPMTIARLMVPVKEAPPRPADTYAEAPEVGRFIKNLLVVKGYRLTTGYVGFFPAAHHALNSPESVHLGGSLWSFSPAGFRQQEGGGAARVRLLDADGREVTGLAQMTADRPGHLSINVGVDQPRIVALTERYHHGWVATSDGKPLQTLRIEGDFLGVRVDPSVQHVELRFTPRSFRDGVLMSIAGVILLIGALVIWPR